MLKWKLKINLLIMLETYGKELANIYHELISSGLNILTWKKCSGTMIELGKYLMIG